MARFEFDAEDQERAVARAKMLKPKVEGVYANNQGYVVDQPNGTTELLVSFKGLADLLGEAPVVEAPAEPVEAPAPEKEEVAADEPAEEKETRRSRRNKDK